MNIPRLAGWSALYCGASYLAGMLVLVQWLLPTGYGTAQVDVAAVAKMIVEMPEAFIAFNTMIYVLNGLALAVLVVALREEGRKAGSSFADLGGALGVVWVVLVLGAGMIANVAVEQVSQLYPVAQARAEALWHSAHVVELGLGGGNEIAGGFWILIVSLIAATGFIRWLGLVVGGAGALTVIPVLGDIAGAVFGLGAVVWLLAQGWRLIRD